MSLTNLQLFAADSALTATWKIQKSSGNAIIAKIRPQGSIGGWASAEATELPASATSVVFSALDDDTVYQVQISQVQFQPNPLMGSLAPVLPNVVVQAAPTGPSVPTGGWKCVMADGFNSNFPLSGIWGPNSDDDNGRGPTAVIPGPNSTEVGAFAASQVSLDENGLRLTAVYKKGVGGPGRDYLSGCVISQNYVAGEPGQQGFPITGFRWIPKAGVVWCIESVIAWPDTSGGGEDPAWWSSTPAWVDEIDHPECWNYGAQPWSFGDTWIYDTNRGLMVQKVEFGNPVQSDQSFHRWTHQFDGNAKTVRTWIDGVERTDLAYAWPSSFSPTMLYMVLSHALRNAEGGAPTWTDPNHSTVMRVRSVAAYQDAPHAGQAMTGGGIAAGTTVK